MNNMRRQKLYSCSSKIGLLGFQIESTLEKLKDLLKFKEEIDQMSQYVSSTVKEIQEIYNEEEEAYYSLPDNLQYSDIGMGIDYAMGNIEDAKGDVEKLFEQLDSLEETYYKFLGTYNPEELICKLESVAEVVNDTKESIEYATKKY